MVHPKINHRIAIVGSRGIPARYGGFETVVEALAPRLVEKGWNVLVSCEGPKGQGKPAIYKGVNLFYFPVRPFFRIIYEVLYDVYSLVKSSLMCDCIYMLSYSAGLFFFIPKIFDKKLAVNVDGLEWERDKFNKLEKFILRISEKYAVRFVNTIIVDSKEIKKYIDGKYTKKAIYITNGVDVPNSEDWDERKLNSVDFLKGLTPLLANDYWLVVGRLEPENNIHLIVQSFLQSNSKRKLIVIGNTSSKKYQKQLSKILEKDYDRSRVVLTGAIYNMNILNMLRQNCFAYIHGHSVGGTNPSLLEAMSMKNVVIAHDNKFNREVGEQTILYFKDACDVTVKITEVENNHESFTQLREAAYSRVLSRYSWHDIVEKYNKLFKELCTDRVKHDR